jgi:hypothetical protein
MIDKVILLFSDHTWSICDNNKENIADYFFYHHWRARVGDKYVIIIELKNNRRIIKRKEDF